MEDNKKEIKSFKSKWEEKDVLCPLCNQVTKRNRGLSKQNMKNFFKKPALQDWIILLMILLTIFGAWAYTQEVAQYKEMIRDPQDLCTFYWQNLQHGNFEGRETWDNLSFIVNVEDINFQPITN